MDIFGVLYWEWVKNGEKWAIRALSGAGVATLVVIEMTLMAKNEATGVSNKHICQPCGWDKYYGSYLRRSGKIPKVEKRYRPAFGYAARLVVVVEQSLRAIFVGLYVRINISHQGFRYPQGYGNRRGKRRLSFGTCIPLERAFWGPTFNQAATFQFWSDCPATWPKWPDFA